jgi:hypothetical protein
MELHHQATPAIIVAVIVRSILRVGGELALAIGGCSMPAVSAEIYAHSIRSMTPWFPGLLYLVHGVDSLSGLSCRSVDQLAGLGGRIACSICGGGKNPCHSPDHNISTIVFRGQRVEFLLDLKPRP